MLPIAWERLCSRLGLERLLIPMNLGKIHRFHEGAVAEWAFGSEIDHDRAKTFRHDKVYRFDTPRSNWKFAADRGNF